jgi:hypothetical protein
MSPKKFQLMEKMAINLNITMNQLFDKLSDAAIENYNSEMMFKRRAKRGAKNRGLEILDKLDASYGTL